MRKIMFRAWDKIGKEMHGFACYDDISCITNPDDSDIIMQYTGLKDKNGVEIYENDIIKGFFETEVVNYDFEGRVVYGGGQFYVESADFPLDAYDEFEVIGNIHENPELLSEDIK
jgi:hypothetical protein